MAKKDESTTDAGPDAGDESSEEYTPESLEERVAHLETILSAFSTAHGETYNGATAHNATLGRVIAANQ
jgi:hypothetical protein